MKTLSRLLAVLLSLALILSLPALAEDEAETADDPILFSIDGQPFTQSQVDAALQLLYANSYIDNLYEYDLAVNYLVQQYLIDEKISQWGLDQFTPEEEEALANDAQAAWDEMLDYYVSYFLTEDTDEARAQERENAAAYYNTYGVTLETQLEELKDQATEQKLLDRILADASVTITEEEIRQLYDEEAEAQKPYFDSDVGLYETYQYYGYDVLYRPDGARGIIQILLEVDDDLLAAYEDAQALYEESLNDENAGDPEELKAAVDAARNAILAVHQDTIDAIYARLANGESFETLIAEYGQDPGMQVEEYLKNGYEVFENSQLYDPAFTAAAFSDKVQKIGDVSDPFIGSAYGIYIVQYLRDIPGGYIEMTDELRAEIVQYLENTKQNEAINAALEAWEKDHEIVKDEALIQALSNPEPAAEETGETEESGEAPESAEETPAENGEEAVQGE